MTYSPYNTTSRISTSADVTISNLADGQVLTYDATTSKWENRAPSQSTGSSTAASEYDADGLISSGATPLNTDLISLGLRIPFGTTLKQFAIRLTPAPVSGATTFVLQRAGTTLATVAVPAGATSAVASISVDVLTGDLLNIRKSADASTVATTAVAATVTSQAASSSSGSGSTGSGGSGSGGSSGGSSGGGSSNAYTPASAPGILNWWPIAQQGTTTDGGALTALVDKVGTRNMSADSGGTLYRTNGFATGAPASDYPAALSTTDGGGSFGQSSSDVFNNISAVTVAMNIKPRSGAAAGGYLFNKVFALGVKVMPDGHIQLLAGGNASAWTVNTTSTSTITMDAVHNLTVVANGTTIVVRVDNVSFLSTAFSGALSTTNANGFGIGAGNEVASEAYHGLIGDIAISNSALTGTDLSNLENYMRTAAGLSAI